MKVLLRQISLLLFIITPFLSIAQSPSTADPETLFLHPPEAAKPGVLWMWMGSNISKEGITKDLEALKKNGFNRTTMFSLADITTPWAGQIGKSKSPEIIAWTEPWWKMVRHAAEESKRLGMDFGMYNGAGYEASGGTWITPEMSMQELCWSQTMITGPGNAAIVLDTPKSSLKGHTPFPIYNPSTGLVEIPDIPERRTYYRDVAVIAVPANKEVISANDVIVISDSLLVNGKLQWTPAPGKWLIYRFGQTTSGTLIQPAQWKATGLECDKMSSTAVNFHMDHIIGEIQSHLGDLIGTGLTHVHFDSYEAGVPTWTSKMPAEFLSRRGYSLLPYLPLFAGKLIGNKEDSVKVTRDFYRTIEDLYRDNYFAVIAKKLADAKLGFLCEPYGGPWKQDEIMPLVGNVMTEFWTHKGKFSPVELEPTVAALRKSGQNIVEAEAFTGDDADSKWNETPAWLKPIGDAAFCAGVNRMVLHRYVEQSFDDRYRPGATMGRWGSHFDRTQTWWEPAAAMVKYWQRCQALLQWGSYAEKTTGSFIAEQVKGQIDIQHIHRHADSTDIYFIANTSRYAGSAQCRFSLTGRRPELWDPVTGQLIKDVSYKLESTSTLIELPFDTAQSYFVVFRNKFVLGNKVANHRKHLETLKILENLWRVSFDHDWGGPSQPVVFSKLTDWTMHPDKGIKYYSGTAIYNTVFNMPLPLEKNNHLYLDLGSVKHIAKVFLNDSLLGIAWTAPWRLQIPFSLIKKNINRLRIEVTNTWANRLIGDEQESPDCEWLPAHLSFGFSLKQFPDWMLQNKPRPSTNRYCFTTWNYFTKDSPLVSSGLMGPVTVMVEK